MLIREMCESDLAQVMEIETNCFSDAWSENNFLDSLRLEETCFLVAEEDGQIAGYIGMYLTVPEGAIVNVAVDERFRKNGVGTLLLGEMLKRAKEGQISQVCLEVRYHNVPAIGLYQKMGFEEIGVRKDFYSFPKEDARIMVWQSI